MSNVINAFEGRYFFLSNFYKTTIEYNGLTYHSVEAAFQAQKCPKRAAEFVELTPSAAKKLGRRVNLRSDWERVKDQIMLELVTIKFSRPRLKTKLLRTGDAMLVEGNTWKDTYWGVYHGEGRNKLGEILMRVREEMREHDVDA